MAMHGQPPTRALLRLLSIEATMLAECASVTKMCLFIYVQVLLWDVYDRATCREHSWSSIIMTHNSSFLYS